MNSELEFSQNLIKNLKQRASLELQLLSARDFSLFNQELNNVYKEWIFSIVVDQHKNERYAYNRMMEQKREMLQS